MNKRAISLMAALTIALSGACALPSGTFGNFDIKTSAATVVAGGPCGESESCKNDVKWKFDTDGTLTIYGTGKMAEQSVLATYSSDWKGFSKVGIIKKIVIEAGVTTISGHAFESCSSVESVYIANNVTKISDSAFAYCSSLKTIIIPNSVTSIESVAFSGCTNLSSVTLPNKITSIESGVFLDCKNLSTITIPKSVKRISYGAFNGCTKLSKLTIPSSVTSIVNDAFVNCTSLKSITIPYTVTSIGEKAFGYDNNGNLISDFKIVGYNYTAANGYATNNKISFESLGNVPGDLDRNGTADIDDLMLMQKAAAGWKVNSTVKAAADYNKDGSIDADDLVMVQKLVAGWNLDQ
ncbi:MAG: leucine-rich repeat protein [Ruminococcus sp.]|nr:leucine-rich repeat protein [Ruminococcus sp.]